MKKILLVATVGGFLPQFLSNDLTLLQEKGYEIHYAANFMHCVYECDRERLISQNIKLHHIDIQKSPYMFSENRRAYQQLKKIVVEEDISVIHCHTPVGGLLGRLVGRYFGEKIRVIYTVHGFHFYKGAPLINSTLYYSVERYLARFTDVLVTINEEDYLNAKKLKIRKGGNVFKIPGVGLDRTKFCSLELEKRNKLRGNMGIGRDTFVLLSVGEVNQNKNHSTVINALYRLNDKNLKYYICGDGFCMPEIMEQIKQLQMEDQVILLGYRTDIAEILNIADCFVFPSFREGLGMACLEAMSVGIPVIASDNRGTREYMKEGITGFICNANDEESFARSICRMKELDTETRGKLQENCREIAEKFSIGISKRAMQEVYDFIDQVRGEHPNYEKERNQRDYGCL